MKFKEQVKVNADIINAYLHRNNITAGEFSAKLLYTNSWWSARRSTKNFIVPKTAAMRMCAPRLARISARLRPGKFSMLISHTPLPFLLTPP